MRKFLFSVLLLIIFLVILIAVNFNNFNFLSWRFLISQIIPGFNEAVFEITPSAGNYIIGNTFSVDLFINTSIAINSVKAYLNFPSSYLQVSSLDFNDSVFGSQWEKTFNNTTGKIQIQASTPSPGFTGNSGLIAKINFQTLALGSASITYDPTSLTLTATDQNVLNLTRSGGATFTIGSSPPPPPSCNNTGLATPSVTPSSPNSNTSFTISCSVNGSGYDCIDAYANNDVNKCTYSHWSGSTAYFTCQGLAAGNYTAKCKINTGTASNCCFTERTAGFTVLTTGGGGEEADITPPVISSIKITNLRHTSAAVTWLTDEPSTSLVEYGTSSQDLALQTQLNNSLIINHQVNLSSLSPKTIYYFKAVSKDGSGNLAKSSIQNFTTKTALIGDLNDDGVVDVYDLTILLSNWRKTSARYDISGDSFIDVLDLSMMLSNWGKTL